MPLENRRDWVAWTPEGFYAASPGAHGVLRWHVNQPGWQPAKEHPVADIPGFYRPEVIKLVLREMETPRAVGLAVVAEQRAQGADRAPTAASRPARSCTCWRSASAATTRAHLRLDFAQQDARDVVSALTSTQEALWVAGSRQYLADADATAESHRPRPGDAAAGDDRQGRPRRGALLRPRRHGGRRALPAAARCARRRRGRAQGAARFPIAALQGAAA